MIARWSPEGFAAYARTHPATPALPAVDDRTPRFAEIWKAIGSMDDARRRALLAPLADRVAVVLVRGQLEASIAGSFVGVARTLRELRVPTVIARGAADGPIARNARMLGDLIRRDVAPEHELVLGGHGRGGLEAMTLVLEDGAIASRTRGLLASQVPRASSPVLAGREPIARIARAIEDATLPCPVLHTASWSTTPTTWVAAFHTRLVELAPGRAHDGLFYLEDLVWRGRSHLLLPELDHAQPTMGGHGLDPARAWIATLATMLELPI